VGDLAVAAQQSRLLDERVCLILDVRADRVRRLRVPVTGRRLTGCGAARACLDAGIAAVRVLGGGRDLAQGLARRSR
jgi:hypothetical protein